MGMMQRNKGKTYERYVAKRFREIFPDSEVFRGIQSREAEESDVVTPLFWVEEIFSVVPPSAF